MIQESSYKRDSVWLFFAILLFFCMGLAARPYLTPSEARYIEVPRQMLATNDWLTPRINGVPYFEKPPLFYWLQASVMQFFGLGEFAGRITTALLDTLLCLVTYATARMLYNRLSGLLAAGALATSMLGYILSRVAMLDTPVSLFLTACMACFLTAQHRGRNWYWGMYIAAALAVLTKGLIGIVIPGIVIGAWIAISKNWRILKEARLFSGLVLFLIIAAPWHILMAQAHPDFLNFYFINEHFTRYLTDSHKRIQPWWFFIGITIAGLLPWTFVMPQALRNLKRERLFLLLWIILPFIFFSASHSKLAPYIYPVFPPLAILLGNYLAQCWQDQISARALRINSLIVTGIFSAIILVYYCVPLPIEPEDKLDFATGVTFPMLIPVIAAIIVLAYVALSKRPARTLIIALMVFAAILDISANDMIGDIDRANVKPLAAILSRNMEAGSIVTSYGSYFQDLPIYLNQNVIVGDYTGELEFGYTHYPETHGWMLTKNEFWQRCTDATQPFYILMKNTTFDGIDIPPNCQLRVLAKYGKTVLLEKIE